MKIAALAITLIMAGIIYGQELPVFDYNSAAFEMNQKYGTVQSADADQTAPGTGAAPVKKTPGKAMLLSAIIPGAGELYAGSPLKAILFFGLEVGAWTGVAMYQADGKDKEDLFQEYADSHWNKGRYWLWMETLPNWTDPAVARIVYSDLIGINNGEFYPPWVYEQFEDDNGFTHNLPLSKDQQYYEMIGKYMTQFGPGWDDGSFDFYPPGTSNFYYWDGGNTSNSEHYMDMRYEANQALDKASMFFQIVMLNHVASALDAGFTVRWHNRKLAETSFNFQPQMYQDETVAMGVFTVDF